MPPPAEFDDFPDDLNDAVMYVYRAVIKRVVDGDTLYVMISTGFNQYLYESLRLRGVDAPELRKGTAAERARGRLAKEFLETLAPPGTPCVVTTYKDRQSFGRYIADVLLPGERDIAEEMVKAGHAVRPGGDYGRANE